MLTVDGDEASTVRTAIPAQIKTGGTYYFGGYFSQTNRRLLQRSFQGCIQMILIDDHLVDLQAVEEGRIGTFENVSLDMCAIIDRCVPNHCEHGGKCSQTWDTFSCNCSGTGYSGATCHTCKCTDTHTHTFIHRSNIFITLMTTIWSFIFTNHQI
ncbi:Contactin-associated protein-like 2 [Characodon lateralis]|uniref:Contactin-associated protein-like 2 n=1 Tax=Characodon lateralis TaxID=208331 RepID=A0ABU7DCE9_9TELE|nr:Contactin-associated protein-like 2 [Characodon lateralis]